MNVSKRFVVSGRVQGVFFRQSTCEQARALELAGWVRNLPDGRVELQAAGEESALRSLQAWLQVGPPSARVEAVEELAVSDTGLPFPFSVRYS